MTAQDPMSEGHSPTPDTKAHAEGPAFAEPEEPVNDLSREIVRSIPRDAGEHVTCRRVSGHYYRCNWWRAVNSGDHSQVMTGLTVATHRVSRSRFLHVTRTGKKLAIAMDSPL